jgi:alpha-ketoglutarate-dependent taurine dioxygenase
MNDVPIRASLLSSRVLPTDGGGDTEFCNTYAAYDDLSEQEKAELTGLRVMHSAWKRCSIPNLNPASTTYGA